MREKGVYTQISVFSVKALWCRLEVTRTHVFGRVGVALRAVH